MNLSNDHRDDRCIPVKRLRLRDTPSGPQLTEAPQTPPFIKGPIPLDWLGATAVLPGKALHVAMAILWLSGMSAGRPFKLTRKSLVVFGVSVDAAQDGLRRLEAAGLITVSRKPGQRPLISVGNPRAAAT